MNNKKNHKSTSKRTMNPLTDSKKIESGLAEIKLNTSLQDTEGSEL